MKAKTFITLASYLFAIGAALHLLRFFMGWTFVIGGWVFPRWLSLVAVFVASYLSYEGFKLSK